MYRRIVASSVILSLLSSSSVVAVECQNPFTGMQSQFQLFEQLSCSAKTSPVVLQLAPVNGTVSSQSPYLTPKCDGQSPLFQFLKGAYVIDTSESLANAHDTQIHVLRTCDGKRLFMIDRNPELLTLPSGVKVNTKERIYAEDDARTLLGYVQTDEEDDDHVTVRDASARILATAIKAFSPMGSASCYATWTVSNQAGDELTATVISFLLTLKDNTEFSCLPPAPPTPAPTGISTGAAIGIGVLIGASVVTAIAVAVHCHMRHRPSHQKLLE